MLLAVTDAAAAAGHEERAWQLPAVLTDYLNREGHWHDLAAVGRTALAAAERAGDQLGQAHAHSSLGVACLQLGCYDTAYAHQFRAIALFGEVGATSWLARTHLSVGVVFDRQGRHDQARMHAERALGIYRASGAGRARRTHWRTSAGT